MIRVLVAALSFILLTNGAKASPVFYTDQASWDAAVAGHPVGPNVLPFSETVFSTTIGTSPACGPAGGGPYNICVLGTSSAPGPMGGSGFTSLSANLGEPGKLYDANCFFATEIPGDICIVTGTSGLEVTFPTPIYGFSAEAAFFGDDLLALNGGLLPPAEGTFFGATGLSSTLDFENQGPLDDGIGIISLSNIQIAYAPEPSSLAMLLAGLGLIGATLIWDAQKRRQQRPPPIDARAPL